MRKLLIVLKGVQFFISLRNLGINYPGPHCCGGGAVCFCYEYLLYFLANISQPNQAFVLDKISDSMMNSKPSGFTCPDRGYQGCGLY